MKPPAWLLIILAGFLQLTSAAAAPRILFFTKSQRTEHAVIKPGADQLSFAERILQAMARTNHWEIETSKDGRIFTTSKLATYDALVFYSNGTLTEPAIDASPVMTEEGKASLIEAVREGKPFIGVHTALTTFNRKPGPVDPYLQMLGAEGIGHNEQQKAQNICVDPAFPGFESLKDGINLFEEWYSNKHFADDLHVILVQKTEGMKGSLYRRPPYPSTWARMYGKGRVFVTSLGHREDVWTNPVFQKLLSGGINWALGRVEADLTPNIQRVTPLHGKLPVDK